MTVNALMMFVLVLKATNTSAARAFLSTHDNSDSVDIFQFIFFFKLI